MHITVQAKTSLVYTSKIDTLEDNNFFRKDITSSYIFTGFVDLATYSLIDTLQLVKYIYSARVDMAIEY